MIHKEDVSVVKEIDCSESGPWIAGGAVLKWYQGDSVHKSDIDVFFSNVQQYEKCRASLYENGWYSIFQSENALTLHYGFDSGAAIVDDNSLFRIGSLIKTPSKRNYRPQKIQLIKRKFYSSLGEVISDFDIDICQAGYNGSEFVFSKNFENAVKTKTFSLTTFNTHILKRAIKYTSYGFKPSQSIIDAIMQDSSISDFSGVNDYDFNF